METEIEKLFNNYGSLWVKKENDKYFASVKCEISATSWEEIKEELYKLLIEFNNQ